MDTKKGSMNKTAKQDRKLEAWARDIKNKGRVQEAAHKAVRRAIVFG